MPESAARSSETLGIAASIKTFKKVSESPGQILVACGLALAGSLVLGLRGIAGVWVVAWAVVAVTDVYLILLLWSAANKSSPSRETWPGLPYRQSALIILPLVLGALVCAFAALYLDATLPKSRLGAAYFSFVNLATFTYDQNSLTTRLTKWIAAAQLGSGLLLLICAFPLLVSRLATFPDDVKGVAVKQLTFNGCKILLRDGDDARITIEENKLTWQRDVKTLKATAAGSGETRTVTVEDRTEPRPAKSIRIEPDGTYEILEP